MAEPITQSQLNALERAVDSVFGKLGIDVDFTRHFLDRVNDERNMRQITLRELGEIFAKEYRKWGTRISKMPVDAEAVMKDLSSAINIPFVLNPKGGEKKLVAKTVMRKKNFMSPDPTLPVESVGTGAFTPESVRASWESYQQIDEIRDPREAILQKALTYLDQKVKGKSARPGQERLGGQSLGSYAFDIVREFNLAGIATARELATMYRDWHGDSVVREGWMESNMYYLDEVVNTTAEAIDHVSAGKNEKWGMDGDHISKKDAPKGTVLATFDDFKVIRADNMPNWQGTALAIMDGKTVAGTIGLKDEDDAVAGIQKDTIQISTSVISKSYEGKAIMYRTYVALIKAGYSLISDSTQSKGGQAIWAKLAKTPGVYVYAIQYGDAKYNSPSDVKYNKEKVVDPKGKKIRYYDVNPNDITDANTEVYIDSSARAEYESLETQATALEKKRKLLDRKFKATDKSKVDVIKNLRDQDSMIKTEIEKIYKDMAAIEQSMENNMSGAKTHLMATAKKKQK
jgi:hypothetical protein